MNTMMLGVVVALTVPLAGTTLGSALAFFMKKQISTLFQKALLGFAAGVMIAASVWSLINPAIDMAAEQGIIPWIPAAVGFLAAWVCCSSSIHSCLIFILILTSPKGCLAI